MQTILGANGVIARELSRQLPLYTDRIRQVSRSPRRVNPTDELFSADLFDAQATAAAVAGSSVTYLVAGLKYDYKVWQEQWPRVMRHAIDVCKRHGSALVFLTACTRTAAWMGDDRSEEGSSWSAPSSADRIRSRHESQICRYSGVVERLSIATSVAMPRSAFFAANSGLIWWSSQNSQNRILRRTAAHCICIRVSEIPFDDSERRIHPRMRDVIRHIRQHEDERSQISL